ncbi:hypothetical protein AABB24_010824 [Solanum stoloniferum]|uniref:Uncharacterized protein n=1 Tax=Solanum stoloniferum TaxID=62892 RepID=A0ABD2UE81_9SOLN
MLKKPGINFNNHRSILKMNKQAKSRGWLCIHDTTQLIENKLEVSTENKQMRQIYCEQNKKKEKKRNSMEDNEGSALRSLATRFSKCDMLTSGLRFSALKAGNTKGRIK